MCNIAGGLKTGNKKYHNTDSLRTLAMYGADRGKDSVGIAYNNGIEYWVRIGYNGTDGNANLIFQNQPFPEKIKTPIVLIHNRAATVGLVDENGAHPYIIDGAMVGMKNGTLYNHEKLAKKYNIANDEWHTDSELLLTIINRYGTEVLKEYIGGCAMAWYFLDEPNKLFLWKGASLNYNKVDEERPLYYVIDEGNRVMYFNSVKIPLQIITNCKYPVRSLPDNTLTIFVDGEIESEEVIDRTKMSQTKPYESTWDAGLFRGGKHKSYHNQPATPKIVEENPQNFAGNRIYHYNGNYYHNGHALDGEYFVDITTQEVVHEFNINNENLRKFYFVNGLWVKDEDTYLKVLLKPSKSVNYDEIHLSAFSRDATNRKWYYKGKWATGAFVPEYFGYGVYRFDQGELKSYMPLSNKTTKEPLLTLANKFFFGENLSQYCVNREEMEELVATWSTVVLDWTNANSLTVCLELAVSGTEIEQTVQQTLELGAWRGIED